MSIEKIRRGITRPETVLRKIRLTLVRPFTPPTADEIDFMNEDWDILVVLDACRYDLLADRDPFNVPVQRVQSNASQTREYIKNNFLNKDYRDTVYVTASPQFADFDLNFAHIEHVWEDSWDDELRTVLPEAVTEAAIQASSEYPDKRLIVHYMQPHYPFIGSTGQSIEDQATFVPNQKYASVWERLAGSDISEAVVREAYRENLDVVLPEVEKLRESVTGKMVVTSDHGNLYGRRVCWLPIHIYGHPARVHHPELTAVPWVEFPHDERREINKSEQAAEEEEFEEVQERLSDLGYR